MTDKPGSQSTNKTKSRATTVESLPAPARADAFGPISTSLVIAGLVAIVGGLTIAPALNLPVVQILIVGFTLIGIPVVLPGLLILLVKLLIHISVILAHPILWLLKLPDRYGKDTEDTAVQEATPDTDMADTTPHKNGKKNTAQDPEKVETDSEHLNTLTTSSHRRERG